MNTEQLNQIIETISTWNININDATTQKLVDTLIPLLNTYLIFDLVKSLISATAIVVSIFIIGKVVSSVLKSKK